MHFGRSLVIVWQSGEHISGQQKSLVELLEDAMMLVNTKVVAAGKRSWRDARYVENTFHLAQARGRVHVQE